tara:strand:- start:2986 stop:3105 length:120 start_codon:yes stop_codon:yes gene_type:complete
VLIEALIEARDLPDAFAGEGRECYRTPPPLPAVEKEEDP